MHFHTLSVDHYPSTETVIDRSEPMNQCKVHNCCQCQCHPHWLSHEYLSVLLLNFTSFSSSSFSHFILFYFLNIQFVYKSVLLRLVRENSSAQRHIYAHIHTISHYQAYDSMRNAGGVKSKNKTWDTQIY